MLNLWLLLKQYGLLIQKSIEQIIKIKDRCKILTRILLTITNQNAKKSGN